MEVKEVLIGRRSEPRNKARLRRYKKKLKSLKSSLREFGISFKTVVVKSASEEDYEGKDLIISFGGDGTVLRNSQYLTETPILPLRANKESHCSLCSLRIRRINEVIKKLLEADFRIQKLTRAVAVHNGRQLALNEVFIGRKYGLRAANYEIILGNKKEEQMSSGVVVTTGTGSTGWYSNIPGNEGPFSRKSKQLRFIVREPIKADELEILKGRIKEGEELKIRSIMNMDGMIGYDGDKSRIEDFPREDIVKIRVSNTPLKITAL